RLPAQWFGYNGIDLLILTTGNDAFLKELLAPRNKERVSAIAEWVRRGGRLVVSVAPRNQERVHRLLKTPYWQPPLPQILPEDGAADIKSADTLEGWVGQRTKPFFPENEIQRPAFRVPLLQSHGAVEYEAVEMSVPGGRQVPLIARMPYGLGNVTFLA